MARVWSYGDQILMYLPSLSHLDSLVCPPDSRLPLPTSYAALVFLLIKAMTVGSCGHCRHTGAVCIHKIMCTDSTHNLPSQVGHLSIVNVIVNSFYV